MQHDITILPQKQNIKVAAGKNLLEALRDTGFFVNAACGGNGSCGKCTVWVDGKETLACRTVVDRDMTVTLPAAEAAQILTSGIALPAAPSGKDGFYLAFDIGTTTVAGYLLNGNRELACESTLNPQVAFGADVVSRIRSALHGHMEELTAAIRTCIADLTRSLCEKASVNTGMVTRVSVVGNPAMQQLFLGLVPENLARLPFAPVLTQTKTVPAKDYIPLCENAALLVIPNISGFVGADTVACMLAAGMDQEEEMTLLVDIGTNGEMVLGNKHRMVACSTAAGPALEGAGIGCGMVAMAGAMDHVWRDGRGFGFSVIGSKDPAGICGSGIIDAVAAALDADLINQRGRIENEARRIALTDRIYLTQEDIRQVQLAKGAIAAGIRLMAEHLGIGLQDIQKVYLAGAFGSYLSPKSICRIGLLPQELLPKVAQVGNAAGSGAKLLSLEQTALTRAQQLADTAEHLQLAALPGFQRCFADCMRFSSSVEYWCRRAGALGFSKAVPLKIDTLQPRQDVRDMCAADKCGAYGKNWTCPPHCGTLTQCAARMQSYSRGILLQTVGTTEKTIDTKAYRRTEEKHLQQFHALCEQLRKDYPEALCLGSGGCRICAKCAFPESCRSPEKACSSMEGYGLLVSQVCNDNSLAYHYGERTITYTACIVF